MGSGEQANVYLISWYWEEGGHGGGHVPPLLWVSWSPEVSSGQSLPEHPASINTWSSDQYTESLCSPCGLGPGPACWLSLTSALAGWHCRPSESWPSLQSLGWVCWLSPRNPCFRETEARPYTAIYISIKTAGSPGTRTRLVCPANCVGPQAHVSELPQPLHAWGPHHKRETRPKNIGNPHSYSPMVQTKKVCFWLFTHIFFFSFFPFSRARLDRFFFYFTFSLSQIACIWNYLI